MVDSIIPTLDIVETATLENYDIVADVVEDIVIKRSFKFDSNTKQFIFLNGRNVETTQVEAIRQWITLILSTYKDKYNIYKDSMFYCNIEDLIGRTLTLINRVNFNEEITNSILTNRAISKVDNFILTQQTNKNILVEFTVTLKDNTLISISEVI